MKRPRLTQLFPALIPLRKKQRCLFFYLGMRFDKEQYARETVGAILSNQVYAARSTLYNTATGFDMSYQQNKVFNLKLAAQQLDGLLIRPGEVFSFWQAVRHADRITAYRDGLTVINGKLGTAPGGGLCQMSNALFWLFLHSPLEIVERHGHKIKAFPDPDDGQPKGVDATISEGWYDLKVRNHTPHTYQLQIQFDAQTMEVALYADAPPQEFYHVLNGEATYTQVVDTNEVYEEIGVYREVYNRQGQQVTVQHLYTNKCLIGYPLPEEKQQLFAEVCHDV